MHGDKEKVADCNIKIKQTATDYNFQYIIDCKFMKAAQTVSLSHLNKVFRLHMLQTFTLYREFRARNFPFEKSM